MLRTLCLEMGNVTPADLPTHCCVGCSMAGHTICRVPRALQISERLTGDLYDRHWGPLSGAGFLPTRGDLLWELLAT